nr:RecName: Full=Ribonuclease [Pleurotus ostreatus]
VRPYLVAFYESH